jgi:hypothetical protein
VIKRFQILQDLKIVWILQNQGDSEEKAADKAGPDATTASAMVESSAAKSVAATAATDVSVTTMAKSVSITAATAKPVAIYNFKKLTIL